MSRYVAHYAILLGRRAANCQSFTPISRGITGLGFSRATTDLGRVGLGLRTVTMLTIDLMMFHKLTGSSCFAGASGCKRQLLSLVAWYEQQNHTPAVLAAVSQQRGSTCAQQSLSAWWLAAGAVAAACIPDDTYCDASTYAAEQHHQQAWWSRILHTADPRRLLYTRSNNAFIQEMQVDPKVKVLLVISCPQSMKCTSTQYRECSTITVSSLPVHISIGVAVWTWHACHSTNLTHTSTDHALTASVLTLT